MLYIRDSGLTRFITGSLYLWATPPRLPRCPAPGNQHLLSVSVSSALSASVGKWYHTVYIFLCLTYLVMPSGSIRVVVQVRISFFFCPFCLKLTPQPTISIPFFCFVFSMLVVIASALFIVCSWGQVFSHCCSLLCPQCLDQCLARGDADWRAYAFSTSCGKVGPVSPGHFFAKRSHTSGFFLKS